MMRGAGKTDNEYLFELHAEYILLVGNDGQKDRAGLGTRYSARVSFVRTVPVKAVNAN